jgi:hypothetical protein
MEWFLSIYSAAMTGGTENAEVNFGDLVPKFDHGWLGNENVILAPGPVCAPGSFR